MWSLRISELVPVRKDGTMLRESSERHATNPAMQFTIPKFTFSLLWAGFYAFQIFSITINTIGNIIAKKAADKLFVSNGHVF